MDNLTNFYHIVSTHAHSYQVDEVVLANRALGALSKLNEPLTTVSPCPIRTLVLCVFFFVKGGTVHENVLTFFAVFGHMRSRGGHTRAPFSPVIPV